MTRIRRAGTDGDGSRSRRERKLPRLERLRANYSYGVVLIAIFVCFFFAALAPDATWSTSVLALFQSITLLLALWTAGWSASERTTSFGLAFAGGLGAAVNLVSHGSDLTGAMNLLTGVLTLAIAFVIAAGAVAQGELNVKSVAGAICVYVLIGMIFTFVFGALAVFGSGPFFAQGTDGTRAIRLYFSFVTLATLGYGDYTAAGNLGHALAVLEALIGQLYLVTVVAVVVTRLRPHRER